MRPREVSLCPKEQTAWACGAAAKLTSASLPPDWLCARAQGQVRVRLARVLGLAVIVVAAVLLFSLACSRVRAKQAASSNVGATAAHSVRQPRRDLFAGQPPLIRRPN